MSSDSQALNLFEQFLERHHEAGASIDALCKEHPRHADRFRRWWNQLLDSGEVSEATIPNAGANQDSETAEDGSRFGAYKILRELGRGSQATVFLAEDTRLNRRVALKVLSSWRSLTGESARRFAREAELASRLDHPGLCTVYERGTSGENAFLAMRLVHGKSLSAMIGQAKRREEAEGHSGALRLRDAQAESETGAIHTMLRLFEEIALALHAAHEAGLIHRDVKPGNIMVDERGKPVLLDFGLAREVESDEPVLTLSGDLVGTPAYMSPEQLAAHRIELDRRTDVYSLAATLFECLTLRRPFEAPTRNELYQAILTAEPARPRQFNPAISRELEVVLWTALDRDRRRRYQTAADLAEDLRRVRCREPIRARPAGPLLRCKRWGQRNPAVAASLIVLLFSLSVGWRSASGSMAKRRPLARDSSGWWIVVGCAWPWKKHGSCCRCRPTDLLTFSVGSTVMRR